MNVLAVAGIGVGLAMDALAVSVASGIAIKNLRLRHAVRIAFFFGLFQAIMPVLGWAAGYRLRLAVMHVSHWVAFVMLAGIGIKMIYESRTLDETEKGRDPLHMGTLLFLAVATSIDAFAVGISFAMVGGPIARPVLIIGTITFVLCLAGVYIGDRFGHFFEKKLETAGGILLIGIGLKILAGHYL